MAALDRATVTVSVWPKLESEMTTDAKGVMLVASVTLSEVGAPVIVGTETTAVESTVTVLFVTVTLALFVSEMVNIVVTVDPGAT